MTVQLHLAARTDLLADALGELLRVPGEDPFAEELVVVPAKGVERWLTQRLAHRLGVGARGGDGVCAGIRFASPRSLVSLLLGTDDDDPWHPDTLVWPLLEVVDESMDTPGFEDLSRHLGHGDPADERSARRYSVARRLAGLFASYAVQRPGLLSAWRSGVASDGAGGELPRDLAWQPELWRRLEGRVAADPPDLRHERTLERLRSGGDDLVLPGRLSLFGHTRLPVTEAELLGALGELRDVHLWLPQASTDLWQALAPSATEGPVPRRDDRTAELVGHPLLASLGRDARELRRTLGVTGAEESVVGATPEAPESLLGWLQADLRAAEEPSADTRAARVVAPDDRSVQVHACHGAARQVDVLREVLVGLLEDDPTLEPRDILVMCPDIESFAPLVSAGFGLADVAGDGVGHPAHRLRVRLADRSPGATNPLLGVAAHLVDLAGGRMRAGDVLDLAASEPVRRRFGFDDDEMERLSAWVQAAAIRWGWDADHRRPFGVDLRENTWRAGLRRVLLGAAMSGQGHRDVGGALPVDDVGDGDLELVGRFAEFLDRLHRVLDGAGAASTVADWVRVLDEGVRRLTSTAPEDAWQSAQLERELSRIAGGVGEGTTPLRHADVRAMLADRLRGRPTRANFRTGTLTVCTMVPMRSVPHRVVCMVGLDDGVFPRLDSLDGDDVLARTPRTGERDVRAEDRQLFLDAITAATETLVITYTGRGEHTGAERPPAVPLGELLDALDRTATPTGHERVADQVVVEHPLQPFDESNLVAGALVGDRPFTFDDAALAGAEAARRPRLEVRELVPSPLVVPTEGGEVSLADLHDFFAHPVRAFCRSRLRVTTPWTPEEAADAIPIQLDGLQKWDVGDRLIRDVLAGADPAAAMTAEQLRGLLPPRELGVGVLEDVVTVVRPLVTAATGLRGGTPRTLDVDIDLGDRRVTGTVDDLFGNNLVSVSYSSLAAKHRVAGWLDALALATGHPDENWTVHTLGRHRAGGRVARVAPLPEHEARAWLRDLVDLYERGLREPIPLPLKTSLAWADEFRLTRAGREGDPDVRGAKEWTTPRFNDTGFPTEDADAWHVRAFGDRAAYSLLAAPLRDGERWNDAPHRLGQFAWRLWGPALEGREVVQGL
ncbi:exodeoxyribonuclease V subunit gamma [Nocardioides rotundus]|uniref:exodeoxyribonuclease V subunit gamma n=1 Tax=Nocardioides rotundus TaxID=1774216 RepID=UPI001CBC88DC|nr:exodeoxyribonuclease V subunit gamma [Nocardioides rotundus]UAL29587.1 exodeoxyribonuclease V subunit gamma [Nocardioides rotundus]